MKLRKKIIISALIILIVPITSGLILIFSRSGYKLIAKPSLQVFDSIIDAKNKGNTLKLNEEEVNSILSMVFKHGITKGDITLYGAEVKIKSSEIYLYSPISCKGIKLLLSSSGSLAEDKDKIIFKPDNISVGRIKLPVNFIFSKLKGEKLDLIEISGDSIFINKSALPFTIKGLQAAGNDLVISFEKDNLVSNKITAKDSISSKNTSTAKNKNISSANKNNETKSKAASEAQVKAAAAQQTALKKLSSQLSSAISIVVGDKEKAILVRIKSSVDKKAANPSYDISKDVSSVKSSYAVLTLKEKNHIKGAILAAVDIENAMEMREIFGV